MKTKYETVEGVWGSPCGRPEITDFDLLREKPTVLKSIRPPSSCRAFNLHFEVHCQVNCSVLTANLPPQLRLNFSA